MRSKDRVGTRVLFNIKIIISIFLFLSSSIMGMFVKEREKLLCVLMIWIFIILYGYIVRIERYFNSLLPIVLNTIFIIKYVVLPYMILIDDNYMSYSFRNLLNANFFVSGSLIAIWEEIFVGVFIWFSYKKWYRYRNVVNIEDIQKNNDNKILFWFIVASTVIIMMNIEVFTDNYNFTWDLLSGKYTIIDFTTILSEENLSDTGIVSTIVSILIQIVYIGAPLLGCSYFYKRFNKCMKKKYYYFTLIMCLVPYMLVTKHSSRSLLTIPIIAGIFMMCILFPRYKKTTIIVSGGAATTILLLLTLWKSFGGTDTFIEDVSLSKITLLLDQYFQGMINLGKANEAYKMSGITWAPHYLINDVIHGIPILSKFTDTTQMSRCMFDRLNLVKDQVIPITGQGLYYFTWVLAPIGVCFIIRICRYMETFIYKAKTLPQIYIYCYATVMLSYACFSSITIFFQKLIISTLPTMVVIVCNSRFKIKK